MGGNSTTCRGGREQEAAARREAKVDDEASIGGDIDIAIQNNNQPTAGASKYVWPFGRLEAKAKGMVQAWVGHFVTPITLP